MPTPDEIQVAAQSQSIHEMAANPEPGVAEAVRTFEAVEQAYFAAIAATPQAVVATSYATTTGRP